MKNEPLTPAEALKQLKPLFPWANWISVDEDGTWNLYDIKPYVDGPIWDCGNNSYEYTSLCLINIAFDGDWRESLTSIEQEKPKIAGDYTNFEIESPDGKVYKVEQEGRENER